MVGSDPRAQKKLMENYDTSTAPDYTLGTMAESVDKRSRAFYTYIYTTSFVLGDTTPTKDVCISIDYS